MGFVSFSSDNINGTWGTQYLPNTIYYNSWIDSVSFGDDQGSCQVFGCTDESACNYKWDANTDDGTCVYS